MVCGMLWIREAGDDVSAFRLVGVDASALAQPHVATTAAALKLKIETAASRRHGDTVLLTRTASSLKMLGYTAGE